MPTCNGYYYRRYDGGTGASFHPVILLHGLGGTHLSWPPVMRRLPGQIVYALDLPGHGRSTDPACADIDCHIRSLEAFFRCMQFRRFSLVGHSMGAMVALAYAHQHPQQIYKLSLLAIGLHIRYRAELAHYFRYERTRNKAIKHLQEHSFHPNFSTQQRKKLFEPLSSQRLSVLHADASVAADFNALRFIRDTTFPIQLVAGEDDALVPVSGVRMLAAKLDNAVLQILKDCGHSIPFEQTYKGRELLIEFLAD